LGEEIEEKEKADSLEIEKKSSKETVKVQPDVCETPSPPAGPVPIPYPNTDSGYSCFGDFVFKFTTTD
jgi:hypothetical protein